MARQDLVLSIVVRIPAGFCLAVGLTILGGWLAAQPELLRLFGGGEPTPAQAAASASLVSLAALMPTRWRTARISAAGIAALLTAASLAETAFNVDFGIDWHSPAAWPGTDPTAGRATIGGAAGIMLIAVALILSPAPRQSKRRRAIAVLATVAAAIALGSLFERMLDVAALLGWHYLNRMPASAAVLLLLLIVPLWYLRLPEEERNKPPRDPAAALLSIGSVLLIAASLLAGTAGLVAMRRGIEDSERANLLATVQTTAKIFEATVDDRLKFARLIATRGGLLAAVEAVAAEPNDGAEILALRNVVDGLVGGDVRGIGVYDASGQLLLTGGSLARRPKFARTLDGTGGARLVWDGRLLLDTNADLVESDVVLGRIVVEQEMPALDTLLAQAAGLGTSGNGAICGLSPDAPETMECLPNRTNAVPFTDKLRQRGALLPVANGLLGAAGAAGTVDSFDRRGTRVIAAFEPLPRFGLAIDLKVDTAELFAPVRERGALTVPILILIVLAGSLILRDRIAPLARQLVEKEREARERGVALEDSRRELLHKNRVLDVALNNMAQGLVLYDENGRLRAFNRRYERMLGFPQGFLRAGLSHTAVRKRSAEFGASAVEEGVGMLLTMATGEAGRQIVERRLRDGRIIEIVHEPLEEGGGVITFSDVTAQRAADAALRAAKEGAEAANRAKSEFLSMMSHEVRTPMNGVLGMIRLLLDTNLAPQQRKYAQTARSSAEALLAILDDILDFSKLEAGRLVLENVPVDLDTFADGILAIMRPLARNKELVLEFERKADLPRWVEIDAARLRQVILNLVGNAVKFTERGAVTLLFGGRPTGGGEAVLSITVKDTGPGIAPEVVPNLFSRFTQADSSISRRFGGTGLGLAISKQLVELMGGSISVETMLGRGSVFRVDLPCRIVARPQAEPEAEPVPHDGQRRHLRILVAEDNPVNQAVVTAMLAPHEHTVEVASDGAEALAVVERGGVDLVFMDIQMPKMDGVAATKAIRALPGPESRVPIVALTANAMAGHREEYLAAGMNDYIAKPLKPEDLARVLKPLEEGGDVAAAPAAAPPAAPQAGPAPMVDTARIAELAAIIPPDGLAAMLDAFFADGEIRLAALAAAGDRHDLEGLRRAAHDIAGMTANYGLSEAEQLARQVIAACHRGDESAAWPFAAAAAKAFRRAEAPLRLAIGNRIAARGTAA
jgi:signal transduction histidine kinase/DNA-binding NarL/FixJ family response regulator